MREGRGATESPARALDGDRGSQRAAVRVDAVGVAHRRTADVETRRDPLTPRRGRKTDQRQDAARDPAQPGHDAPIFAGATRRIELSVPNSSDDGVDDGSTTQRLPSTMNAYSCRPGDSGNDTDHTPGLGATSGVLSGRHSLKSPTIETDRAVESTKTNRTNSTVSAREVSRAGPRVTVRVEDAATTAIAAAIASADNGDATKTRPVSHQLRRARVASRRATSARACAISRASKSDARISESRKARMTCGSSPVSRVSSRIVHPFQQFAQPVARPANTHLERRNTDARYFRHLIVAQLFDVLQY